MNLERPSEFDERAPRGRAARALVSIPHGRGFGAGLLLGCAAAGLGTLPAALRVAALGAPFVPAWLALAGSAGSLVGVVVGAARAARPFPDGLRTVMAGTVLAFGPLIFFAQLLWAGTHHRPLGAVTFSFGAALMLLAAMAGAARLRAVAADPYARSVRPLARGTLWMAGLFSILLAAIKLPAAALDPALRFGLVDGGVLLVLTLFSIAVPLPLALNRAGRIIGPIVYSALAVAAAAALKAPELRAALMEDAPVPFGPWAWLL